MYFECDRVNPNPQPPTIHPPHPPTPTPPPPADMILRTIAVKFRFKLIRKDT